MDSREPGLGCRPVSQVPWAWINKAGEAFKPKRGPLVLRMWQAAGAAAAVGPRCMQSFTSEPIVLSRNPFALNAPAG